MGGRAGRSSVTLAGVAGTGKVGLVGIEGFDILFPTGWWRGYLRSAGCSNVWVVSIVVWCAVGNFHVQPWYENKWSQGVVD